MGITLEIIELTFVKDSGHGNDVLGFVAQVCNYLTQYLICCLFIFLGAGWTISFDSILDFEMFLPISILVAIVKFFIMIIG